MAARTRAAHWDAVYCDKPLTEASWYEEVPATSIRLVTSVASVSDAIVDVGAGTSYLVDRLLAEGYQDVTVLDVSAEALAAVMDRLAERPEVRFIVSDVVAWTPERQYDVWHDRAVFHFLTDRAATSAYINTAAASVPPGGVLIVGTFAEDGPTSCSGLPTATYTPHALAARFADFFVEEHQEREEHVTPSGVVQPFTWLVLRRK